MGAASIAFTDGSGAATLDNGLTAVAAGAGSHFSTWTPDARVVGPRRASLGTGAPSVFRFRTDYVATFELRDIPQANMATAQRLIEWLRRGNTCAVTTGDQSANVYASCALAEGADAALRQQDPVEQTWTLTLTLVNLGAAPMLCTYP